MSYASEKLYDGCIRHEMATIASKVRVREILLHLPCLTLSDREEIEAKDASHGNSSAMQMLLDYLRRRRNWPEQFIRALERCEQQDLADKIGAKYESLQGPRHAAVVPAANAHPVQASDPGPSSHPLQPSTPLEVERLLPQPTYAHNVEVEGQLPQPDSHPVANSGEQNSISANSEASVVATPPHIPAMQSVLSLPGHSSQISASSFSSLSSSIPPASETNKSIPAAHSSEPQMSPVKPPVQDSNLPVSTPTQQPVENSDPTVSQVAASNRQAHPVQGSSPQPSTRLTAGADATDSPRVLSLPGGPENDVLLSRPGTLLSCIPAQRAPSENQAVLAAVNEEPYSGGSNRLQFSLSSQGSQAPSGITVPSLNEPEEDHYESVQRSLLSQDVRYNVGHISEDPSLQNHAGQAPRASDEQPSQAPLQNHDPPQSESITTGPGQQTQRGFPFNMLEHPYVMAAAIAGMSALVLWRRRK